MQNVVQLQNNGHIANSPLNPIDLLFMSDLFQQCLMSVIKHIYIRKKKAVMMLINQNITSQIWSIAIGNVLKVTF